MKHARYTHQDRLLWWFLIIAVWRRVINDPDIFWIGLCMIMSGFIMPWLFRLLALIVELVMVGLGIVFLVTGIIRGFQRIAMRVIKRKKEKETLQRHP
jgi:hypothetical protein